MCQSQVLLSRDGKEIGHLHDVAALQQCGDSVRVHFLFAEPTLIEQAQLVDINLIDNTVKIALV